VTPEELQEVGAGEMDPQSAPNPILSTPHYFGDEYRAQVERKRCPAGVCRMAETFEHAEAAR